MHGQAHLTVSMTTPANHAILKVLDQNNMEMPASVVKALEAHENFSSLKRSKVTWRTGVAPIAFVRSWRTGTQFDIPHKTNVKEVFHHCE